MIDDFRPVRPPKPAPSVRTQTQSPEQQTDAPIKAPDYTKEPDFMPPEQVAAHDNAPLKISMDLPDTVESSKATSGRLRTFLKPHWPPTKANYIVLVVLVLLFAAATFGIVQALHHKTAPVAIVKIKPKPQTKPIVPTTVPSTLTGLPVDPTVNQRPVTAVMIENSIAARPQSGLGQAGIVFEAVAEGGVTRFMALFQDTAPNNVGPVRSARPYFLQWAMGFDAAYAHVGGSPAALQDIKSWGVRDLDQFFNSGSYHRISTRAAPHNVYTAISTLNQLEAQKGFTSSSFTGFTRKKDSPSAQPNATSLDFKLSGYYYDPHFDYDATTNSYKRSEAGQAQIDANTSTQISPKVVIAMVVPEQRGPLDSTGAYYSDYNPIGSGAAYIFQDGTVTQGTWSKDGNGAALTLTDSNNQPLALNAGQTWITAVTDSSSVLYK